MDNPVQNSSDAAESAPEADRISFSDRLLAEAVRVAEASQISPTRSDEATRIGLDAGGDLENRIVRRAAAVPIARKLIDALHQVRAATMMVVMAGVFLSLIAGGGAAVTALGPAGQEPVNVFWVLGSLLGVQTALLLAWLIVMVIPTASTALSVASLGGIALSLGRRASRWINKGLPHAAAVEATVAVGACGSVGRWSFSAVSHALWLAFNVGVLVLLVTLLTVRQYAFAWETTILTADSYVTLTRGLGWLPRAAGINTPDEVQIRATRGPDLNPQMHEAGDAWSGFIVGCMLFYAFGPRLLLLGFSLGQRRAACRRFRLDTSLPEYLNLRTLLMPATESLAVAGGAAGDSAIESDPDFGAMKRADTESRPLGPPAILGLELLRIPQSWPPRLPHPALQTDKWWDLGLADGRDDRLRILRELADSPTEPSTLIAVCALTTTPDRGVAAFLADLAAGLSRSPILLLTAGDALRGRAEISSLDERIADWRDAAARAVFEPDRVIELDLDNVTDASAAKLAALMGGDDAAAVPARRIESAFGLIVEHLLRWSASATDGPARPTAAQQAELHRELASLYHHEQPRWRDLLHGSSEAVGHFAERLKSGDVGEQLKAGGERMVRLLPPRLRSSSRWLAAGATAGALGCVAAAALISPIAIGSLPIWAGLGASIAGAASLGGRSHSTSSRPQDENAACGLAHALRAATLFALLLETQGRGEATITRILDASIPEESTDESTGPYTPQTARIWLDDVRHRFDLALAGEAAS